MNRLLAALTALALASCVAPVGPVEVTRFHVPELAALGRGAIAVEPAPGQDAGRMEFGSYAGAVSRQLSLLGYSAAPATDTPDYIAVKAGEKFNLVKRQKILMAEAEPSK